MNLFSSREEASRESARLIASALRSRLAAPGLASLVVSGGSSPARCFELLSQEDLAWSRVRVALTDERCVPVNHAASNEGMLRQRLLLHRAANAAFVPTDAGALAALERPLDVALVGMGEDGHFASIFPDSPALATLLDPDNMTEVVDITTASSEYRRRTVSLSFLLQSRVILLLAFGEAKRQLLMAPGKLPVAALLQQTQAPVTIHWAP